MSSLLGSSLLGLSSKIFGVSSCLSCVLGGNEIGIFSFSSSFSSMLGDSSGGFKFELEVLSLVLKFIVFSSGFFKLFLSFFNRFLTISSKRWVNSNRCLVEMSRVSLLLSLLD